MLVPAVVLIAVEHDLRRLRRPSYGRPEVVGAVLGSEAVVGGLVDMDHMGFPQVLLHPRCDGGEDLRRHGAVSHDERLGERESRLGEDVAQTVPRKIGSVAEIGKEGPEARGAAAEPVGVFGLLRGVVCLSAVRTDIAMDDVAGLPEVAGDVGELVELLGSPFVHRDPAAFAHGRLLRDRVDRLRLSGDAFEIRGSLPWPLFPPTVSALRVSGESDGRSAAGDTQIPFFSSSLAFSLPAVRVELAYELLGQRRVGDDVFLEGFGGSAPRLRRP